MNVREIALRLRATKYALGFAVLLGFGLCCVPLLGVHGVESALFMGVLLPPFAAVIGARLVIWCREKRLEVNAMRVMGGAVFATTVVVAVPGVLLAFNSLRVRNCSPLLGLLFVLLGPFFGAVLATITGVVVGAWITRPRLATLICLSIPLGAIGVALYRLYATPAIFAYGHFFGYFPGTFYDEDITLPTALLTLRAATFVLGGGLVALFACGYDKLDQRFRLRFRDSESVFLFSVAIGSFFAAGLVEFFGPELGHRTTSAWIESQLERQIDGTKCRARFPRELNNAEAHRLAQECEFRVSQMENWFGVTQKEPVVAFFFRSAEEKRALVGAHTTYVAKPWLNQVYLQLQPWPHPVIAHEIAHVVAANTGSGPFRIAGKFGGLWPNPALIEGVAVAAAWSESDELTPHEWARAMIETGFAPPLEAVFGAGFLSQPKGRAYVLAGSLMRYVKDNYGADAIRRIYATGDIESVTKIPFKALEKKWREAVMNTPLPEYAHALARARFAKGSIFSSVCPHQVARLRSRLDADLSAMFYKKASTTCREILEIDPSDAQAFSALVGALAQNGELDAAKQELTKLETSLKAPPPLIAPARQALADAYWRRGDRTQALGIYRSLLELPLSNDATRLLEVKSLALTEGREQEKVLFELLVGDDGSPTDAATAVYLARELRSVRVDGLPYYLEARQLFFKQRFRPAARLLQIAARAGLPTQRLRIEAMRIEGISLFALGEWSAATERFKDLESQADGARRVEARDWLERLSYTIKTNPSCLKSSSSPIVEYPRQKRVN
jgi:tetratricopeptide (TPR) repeat protein